MIWKSISLQNIFFLGFKDTFIIGTYQTICLNDGRFFYECLPESFILLSQSFISEKTFSFSIQLQFIINPWLTPSKSIVTKKKGERKKEFSVWMPNRIKSAWKLSSRAYICKGRLLSNILFLKIFATFIRALSSIHLRWNKYFVFFWWLYKRIQLVSIVKFADWHLFRYTDVSYRHAEWLKRGVMEKMQMNTWQLLKLLVGLPVAYLFKLLFWVPYIGHLT